MSKLALRMSILTAAAVAGQAAAGSVNVGSVLSDNSAFLAEYSTLMGAPVQANHIAGISGGDTLEFSGSAAQNGTFSVDITANDAGSFFLGTSEGLMATNTGGWFYDGEDSQPADGTLVLAFGNSAFTSNEVTLDFNPGVTAFGFNYDDVEWSSLTVVFRNESGTYEETVGPLSSAEGFISLVADAGETIDSIILSQGPAQANDGFTFYGFQTLTVVPVPGAALAGFGMLGGLGVARKIRRK